MSDDTETVFIAEYSEGIDTVGRRAADSPEAAFEAAVDMCRVEPVAGSEALEHTRSYGGAYGAKKVWELPRQAWNEKGKRYGPGIVIYELVVE